MTKVATGFQFNPDYERRNKLLRLTKEARDELRKYEICQFRNLRLATVETLLEERFIDPTDRQNEAPSVAECHEFMKRFPQVRAHGYAVSHQRPDYRVSLEGVHVPAHIRKPLDLSIAFFEFTKGADLSWMDSRNFWAWWD